MQADISKRLVKGGMNRIKDIMMRFTSALALLAAGALPLGYAAAPTIAHGFEKSHDHGPSKAKRKRAEQDARSEEHTSELQSLMRISYSVFCLKKTNKQLN